MFGGRGGGEVFIHEKRGRVRSVAAFLIRVKIVVMMRRGFGREGAVTVGGEGGGLRVVVIVVVVMMVVVVGGGGGLEAY